MTTQKQFKAESLSDREKEAIVQNPVVYADHLRQNLGSLEGAMVSNFYSETSHNPQGVTYNGNGDYKYEGPFLGREGVKVDLFTVCDSDSILGKPDHHFRVKIANIMYTLNDSGTIDMHADDNIAIIPDASPQEVMEEMKYGIKVARLFESIVDEASKN